MTGRGNGIDRNVIWPSWPETKLIAILTFIFLIITPYADIETVSAQHMAYYWLHIYTGKTYAWGSDNRSMCLSSQADGSAPPPSPPQKKIQRNN